MMNDHTALTQFPPWPPAPPRLVYYTGFDMWMPVYTSNGVTNVLTCLMMGGAGSNQVDFATALTTFSGASNAATLGTTFTFPTTTNDAILLSFGNPPQRTGDYTAMAIDEAGAIWGAGEVVGPHLSNNPDATNWGTVVFRVAGSE
jgi:hypothetical protein